MNIKAIRKQLGMTQEELAHELGVSWNTISRWELKGTANMSKLGRKAVERLCQENEIQIDEESYAERIN